MADPGRPPGAVRQQLEFLLNGFSFYAQREQVRADDLLVRQRAGSAVAKGAEALRDLAADYRRRFLPEPSRERPLPPAEAMAGLRAIESLRAQVADAEVRVRSQGFPASDRTWRRLRDEQVALDLAFTFDHQLIAEADALERACRDLGADALGPAPGAEPAALAPVREHLRALATTLEQRTAHLSMPG